MTLIAILLSLLISCVGVVGLIAPSRLIVVLRSWQNPRGLYLISAFRLLLGTSLFLAAARSKAPNGLRLMSALLILSGLATPLFGVERFRQIVSWLEVRNPVFIRFGSSIAVGIGLWLAYLVVPQSKRVA